jgi:hypothetical protein
MTSSRDGAFDCLAATFSSVGFARYRGVTVMDVVGVGMWIADSVRYFCRIAQRREGGRYDCRMADERKMSASGKNQGGRPQQRDQGTTQSVFG